MAKQINIHILKYDGKFSDDKTYTPNTHIKTGGFDVNIVDQWESKTIDVYENDTIYDLKVKIFAFSGIHPFRQHIARRLNKRFDDPYYCLYIGNNKISTNISNPSQTIELYQNKDNIRLDNEEIKNYIEFCDYNVAVLDDFIKSIDSQERMIFYYSFVIKYFPMMASFDIFEKYLNGDNIKSEYPLLYPNISDSSLIQKQIYDVFTSKESDKYYTQYVYNKPPKTSIDIEIKIIHIIFDIPLGKEYRNRIDITNLFNAISIDENIILVKLVDNINLVKLKYGNVIKFYNYYHRHMSTGVNIIIQTPIDYISHILLIIKKSGDYSVVINLNVKNVIVPDLLVDIKKIINTFISKINGYGRNVFISSDRLRLASPDNVVYKNVEFSINWYKQIAPQDFMNIKSYIQADIDCELISIDKEETNNIRILYNKISLNGEFEDINNMFDYFINVDTNKIINSTWKKQKIIDIEYIGSSLMFKIHTTNFSLIPVFFEYVIFIIYRIDKMATKSSKVINKTLKQHDPVLYNFKKYGTVSLYSRKCQKPKQPKIINEDELTKHKNAVKYWNFTTNTPEYYICPNSKYPQLNFMVGIHPANYCVPCCQKTSNKPEIFDKCLTERILDTKKTNKTDRHVSIYNKVIPNERLAFLPKFLKNYIDSTLNKHDILASHKKIISIDGIDYDLHKLKKTFKYNKLRKIDISDIKNIINESKKTDSGHTLSEVLNNQTKFKIDISKIRNTKIDKPILLLKKEKGVYDIIDGIYGIGYALINNKDSINAIIISLKQLRKIRGGKEDTNLDVLDFYIYGVRQSVKNFDRFGSLYVIADVLNKSIFDAAMSLSAYLKENNRLFNMLFDNKLNLFFDNQNEFIANLISLINDEMYSGRVFNYWNEVVLELFQYMTRINVIIIEHDILNNRIRISNIDTKQITEFIIIIKIIDETLSINNDIDIYYYPIYTATKKNFFKNKQIEQKIFNITDPIIKTLNKLINNSSITKKSNIQTSSNMKEFKEPDIYYTNNSDICHAIGYNIGKDHIIIPISYTNISSDNTTSSNFDIEQSNIKYKDWKKFIVSYNLYMIEKHEVINLVKSKVKDGMTLKEREDNIIKKFPIFSFHTVLVFNKLAVGVADDNFYYYFSPAPVNDVIAHLMSDFPLIRGSRTFELMYHPNKINEIILDYLRVGEKKYKYKDDVVAALYNVRVYSLFMASLFSKIDKLEKKDNFVRLLSDINNKSSLITLLNPLLESAIEIGDISMKNVDVNYKFELCDAEREYCKNKKLLISRKLLDTQIDNFYNDLLNPMKRDLILSLSYIHNIQHKYNIMLKTGESLFVLEE
jgi:hypothetical protein